MLRHIPVVVAHLEEKVQSWPKNTVLGDAQARFGLPTIGPVGRWAERGADIVSRPTIGQPKDGPKEVPASFRGYRAARRENAIAFLLWTDLPDDQHGAGRKMDQPVGAAAEHAFIKLRMAGCPNHEEISFDLGGKPHDIAHGMPGH
jgi:hypothetical protein